MIVKELDLVGKNLSNYKVVDRLGKGGMATVYKAHELSLNRMVALKVLSPQLSEDSDFIKRFQREAQAAAQLNHPNIVQIYAIGEEQGLYYFAMEYIKGEPLSDLKKREGLLHPVHAMSIIKQVAEALGEAHEAGLIHRDVKPCNIMLDSLGRAKVTDFGIAYVSRAQTKLTREGSIIGTPEYLSPEQCEGKQVDGRSDIYSLGVSFYEILTGKTPYEADTPVSMLMKIVSGKFLPIEQVNPNIPQPIAEIVKKMMRTKPEERYASTTDLIAAITNAEKILSEQAHGEDESLPRTEVRDNAPPIKIPLSRDTNPAPVEEPVEATIQREYPETRKKSGRGPALAIAAVIVLLMAGAFAAKVFYFDKQDKKPEPAAVTQTQSPDTAASVDSTEAPPQSADTTDTAGTGESTDALSADSSAGDADSVETPSEDTTTQETPSETAASEDSATVDSATAPPPAEAPAGDEPVTTPEAEHPQQPVSSPSPASATAATTAAAKKSQTPRRSGSGQPRSSAVSTAPPGVKQPPAKSAVFAVMGNTDTDDLIGTYLQAALARDNYQVSDEASLGRRNAAEAARFRFVINTRQMPSTKLNAYGANVGEQMAVRLTVKVLFTRDNRLAAGPVVKIIRYTSLNMEDNFKEEIEALVNQLKRKLAAL